MAKKVSNSARLPIPISLTSYSAISSWATTLIQQLSSELREHAFRINNTIAADGTEGAVAPTPLKSYVKASLPDAATYENYMIIVSDDVGGLTPAFSDGTDWRRTSDRAVIS